MDNFLWGVAAGVLGVAALAFFAFTMFRRGPLTFQIDGFTPTLPMAMSAP